MRTVRLNGELGKIFGRVHRLAVQTPAEAIRALCANFPEFRHHLVASEARGVGYRCVVDRAEIDADGLLWPMSRTFSITPVVMGGGKIGKILLGGLMIATGMGAFGALGTFMGVSLAKTIGWLGVAVTLSGVAQLLAPTPRQNKEAERDENRYFDGPVNVSAQGAAVPFGYGRMIVGSALISASISVETPGLVTLPYEAAITGFSGDMGYYY